MPSTQADVASLLQSIVARGIEAREALPIVKALVEQKIFDLNNVTDDTRLPSTIPSKLQKKIRPKRARQDASSSSSSSAKKKKVDEIQVPPVTEKPNTILINRSPVLTLWASVVAQKLFTIRWDEALSFGSAFASQTAQGKGESLGIFSKGAETTSQYDKVFELMVTGIGVQVTEVGLRAIGAKGEQQDPARTWKLLQKKFGSSLGFVYDEMNAAVEQAGDGLGDSAYRYYMSIRPDIPEGTKGWGAHGRLETRKLGAFYTSKPAARRK